MENKTDIVFVIDKSGSMSGLEKDTVGGINSIIKTQKGEPGSATVTTVLFNHKVEDPNFILFRGFDDEFYAPQSEGAIAWNDPTLAIDWLIPTQDIILSEKDKCHPLFNDFETPFSL